MRISHKYLLWLIAAPPILVLVATGFYMLGMKHLEGEPRDFWTALGFAAETLTTTGYGGDSHWQHPVMVLFVIVLQFLGVALVFLIIPIYLIPFLEERFEARLPRTARRMKQHVVIYRFGPAVENLLEELERTHTPALVAEQDESAARRLVEDGVEVVYGATIGALLETVHLAQARALIANGSDSENASLVLTARQLGFSGEIMVLVEEPHHRRPIMLAGASIVFTPRHILAATLAARASHRISPRVSGIQMIGHKVQVAELRIDPSSSLSDQSLAEADVGRRTGTTIIGQWVEGRLLTQPDPTMRLVPRGVLVAMGSRPHLEELAKLAGGSHAARHHGPFIVAGYGEVGRKVVQLLRDVGEKVLAVDRKGGDGVDVTADLLDPPILESLDLPQAQAMILALDSDSTTLFATVIIRDLVRGLPIIARVNEAENVERIHRAGADFALSLSQVSGQMLAEKLLGEAAVTVDPRLKVMRIAAGPLTGHHPADLQIRERTGCSVVAVERGDDVLVDFGRDFRFESDDAVFICGSNAATRRFVEELL